MGENILAFDLGTTALKCAIHATNGNVIAKASQEYQLLTSGTDSVEMEVETYWQAFCRTVRRVLHDSRVDPASIKAVGISAQGETLILVDSHGAPLRPAIVWLDNRPTSEADELAGHFGDRPAYEITGQVKLVPTWPASKILWLKHNEPRTFERTAKFLLIEDYFIYRLTGEFVCEGSLVTSSCYWNFKTRTWWGEMLNYLGIRLDQLPAYLESGEVVGKLLPQVADELGLHPDTLVCTGALDQACGAIGVGNFAPGIFSENTGAALAICATVDTAVLDPASQMPCHYHGVPGLYMLHTFTGGGIVLRWFRDEFAAPEKAVGDASGVDAYELLGMQAAKVPAGSEGLLMLPHLQGAMAPESNPLATGVFYGLTLHHGKAHFVRAIMEAVCYVVRRNIEVIERMGVSVREIRSLGGGARSRLWKQIEADVTGREVVTTENEEAATLGAAILAGKAIGIYGNVKEAAQNMVHVKEVFEPNYAIGQVYNNSFTQYVDLYNALEPVFSQTMRGGK